MYVMTCHSDLVFYVNGIKIVEKCPDPEWTLLYYIRNSLHLTGTKLGCAEGGCGACTVMISRYDRFKHRIVHYAADACLVPLCSVHGLAVTTVEGIGSTRTKLHPVQERLAKSHGSQCGFCTPGIVMSMYTLLRNTPQPSITEIENAFSGNLCRCTGYRPILEGFKTFTKTQQCPKGEDCCQNRNECKTPSSSTVELRRSALMDKPDFAPYEPDQEPIFPSELQLDDSLDKCSLYFQSDRIKWYRPYQLDDLLELKQSYPDARLVVGNTEVGVETKLKNMHYPVIIAPSHVPELLAITKTEHGISFGGSVSLSCMEQNLKDAINDLPEHRTGVFAAVVEMLRWFAGHQIRNVSSIAGNLMTASPISDLNPLWLAAGCLITVASKERGQREIVMDHTFFSGYRQTAVKSDEVLINITVPYTDKNEYFCGYKQAHRREDDIAIVNAGMRVSLVPGTNVIDKLVLAYGGMAPTTVMASKTMEGLNQKAWDEDLIPLACSLLADDLPLPPGVPGGSESYRRTLTASFFFKFYLHVLQKLEQQQQLSSSVPSRFASAIPPYERPSSHGTQVFEEILGEGENCVGKPIVHHTALQQATGEAKYCDDVPKYDNELYLALVLSTKAHANIVSVDPSEALRQAGVVDYISHKDVPGIKGVIIGNTNDQEIFATKQVTTQGKMIGCILAENKPIAQRAAKLVHITYEELDPIITTEQAIDANSYFDEPLELRYGDTELGFSESDHVLEGEVRIGGQEHFYLETQSCIAVPKGEDDEMEIFSSTQSPNLVQAQISSALLVPRNRITVRVKRIGGGFGGKEVQASLLALPVAVAAKKHNRPVRCMLDRSEDMVMTGTRQPFLGRYKVGFTADGKILALKLDLFSNYGHSLDLSGLVLSYAMAASGNSYKIPHMEVTGHQCKTNTASNTAFRGFGASEGMFICESWMTHVAEYLKMPQEQLREINLYEEGDPHATRYVYNPMADACNLKRCWHEVKTQSNYQNREQTVAQFNKENRWRKRGISLIPTMFGIGRPLDFMNQNGALVHVYKDDSVLLTHGAVEMGQGLQTKMIQVAGRVLGIPLHKIFISETNTSNVPNATNSSSSICSDLCGMAVLNACQTIRSRLEPYITKNPTGDWESWVMAAFLDRVSLSATGFFAFPTEKRDKLPLSKGPEHIPYFYFVFGAACSEVEIDCLTGDHTVLKTDIVMDLGRSLNPAVDIGQIEGAFVQGYGLFVLEEQRYSPAGYLYTRGPGTYKIPSFSDIPIEFNVSLLKGASNPKNIYSSKGVGEPPLFLSASVFFAIRQAISAAREDAGSTESFRMDAPATSEQIRMLCVDQFTEQFPPPQPGTFTPWSVAL